MGRKHLFSHIDPAWKFSQVPAAFIAWKVGGELFGNSSSGTPYANQSSDRVGKEAPRRGSRADTILGWPLFWVVLTGNQKENHRVGGGKQIPNWMSTSKVKRTLRSGPFVSMLTPINKPQFRKCPFERGLYIVVLLRRCCCQVCW